MADNVLHPRYVTYVASQKGVHMATPTQTPDLSAIGAELDQISLQKLEETYPTLANTISQAIHQGATAADVRRFALAHGVPRSWADWLCQAARALGQEEL